MAIRDDSEHGPLERLVDVSGDRGGEAAWIRARAVELLKSADPFSLPTGRKQRLLLSLGQGWVRRRSAWLRPIVVGALLIGSGAIASAALTSWPRWLARSYRTLVSEAPAPAPRPRQPAVRVAVTTGSPAPERVPPIAVAPSSVVRRPAEVHVHRPPIDQAFPAFPAFDDPALLLAATRALRADRDPKLARDLAARYLERHPSGALADEAFAISIEAAIDHHDPDVAALSARYLTLFPRGSFRGFAERSLKSPDR